MTAPTTPATPAKVYVLAEGTKFGIPVTPAEAGLATVEVVNAAKVNIASGNNTTVSGTGAAGDPIKVSTPAVSFNFVNGKYEHVNEAGTKTILEPGNLVAPVSGNLLTVTASGQLVVMAPKIKDVFCE